MAIYVQDQNQELSQTYPAWVSPEGKLLFDFQSQEDVLIETLTRAKKHDYSDSWIQFVLLDCAQLRALPSEVVAAIADCFKKGFYDYLANLSDLPNGVTLPEPNMVDSPAHYHIAGIEVIDLIRAATADLSGSEAYELGNAIKYLLRYQKKGKPAEDLRKCRKHIDWLIDRYEN